MAHGLGVATKAVADVRVRAKVAKVKRTILFLFSREGGCFLYD